jgi:hypothetical protein
MTDITGTRVVLDRGWCCQPHMIVARRKRGGCELRCSECNSRKGRLSEMVAGFLQETWLAFGPPRAPIDLTRDQQGITIMNREDVFPSRYFKAANLPQPRNLTIVAAKMEEMKSPDGGETQNRLVLHFRDEAKRLVVNAMNFDAIADIVGSDETKDWIDTSIQLYADKTRFGKKIVDCVRVRATSASEQLNDKIDF